MTVNFTATGPTQSSWDTPDTQTIGGTESTKWKSWKTDKDNSDIPVKTADGTVVGYVDAEQATKMKELASQGYKITDPSGQEVSVGQLGTTETGDTSNKFDDAFSNFLGIHPSVKPDELVKFVQKYFPGVKTVDDAMKVILRNSSYQAAVQTGHSVGVGTQHQTVEGHQSTGGTINFYKSTDDVFYQRAKDGPGVRAYEQSGEKITVSGTVTTD